VLVLAQRERDPVEAAGRRALADELVVVETPELDRLLLDGLVHRSEQDLVLGEPLFACLLGGLMFETHPVQSSRCRTGEHPVAGGSERISEVEIASAFRRPDALHPCPKSPGIDRGEPVEQRFDLVEVGAQQTLFDESGCNERADVIAVLCVVALELRESLRVGIEVGEEELPASLGRQAPLLPAGGQWNEVVGRGELDVDLELVLEARDRAQDGVLVGNEFQVDVDRRPPPAEQYGGRSARQVADPPLVGRSVERGQ
jgi:hypothetical protein